MKRRSSWTDLLGLVAVIAAALTPMFLLANEVDGDEYAKAATGTLAGVTVGALVAIYKIWDGRRHNGDD